MKKNFTLEAQVRQRVGTAAAAQLRKQGRIPATIYGHQETPVSLSVDRHAFTEGLHHGHRLMDVTVDGQSQAVLVKDLQYDHLGRDILHVDLMRVNVRERVKVSVPIELKGTAQGTHEGGMIEEHVDQLEVEAMVSAIPDLIVVSVKDVGLGQALHAGDVPLPEGIVLASPADTVIVTCPQKAAAKSAEDEEGLEVEEEGATSPEVLTERKDEDAS